jgi:RNA polymerase sigma-70 factor (ECF subfamily)
MGYNFETTRWSLVLSAREETGSQARTALATLCEAYWYPMWAFVRRQGYDVEAASDLTQGYFSALLEKHYLGDVSRSAGRFRSFLLVSMKHYLSKERVRERALKRGGGTTPISLDAERAEGRYRLEPVENMTPEMVFERHWALTVAERAIAKLQADLERRGRANHFEQLEAYLLGGEPLSPYKEVATRLGMSEGAVKVAIHRLRKRLGGLLREEIANTVANETEIDGELRHLLEVLES